jgi:hypothetical protein
MLTTTTTARVTAFFAAAAVTAVLLGSQFGLARHYDPAGALLAGQPAAGGVALAPVQRTAG